MQNEIIWDEEKRKVNIKKHYIDFFDIVEAFDGRFSVQKQDTRFNYGESRYNRLTMMNGLVIHITFTIRESSYRLISARRANKKERDIYAKNRKSYE